MAITKKQQSNGGKSRAETLTSGEKAAIASEGGNARKEKLTTEEREKIASKGGQAKNGK